MFVALVILHVIRMLHICNCDLPISTIFYSYSLINGTKFEKKVIIYEMRVLIFSSTFVCNIFHSMKKEARCDNKCMLIFKQSNPLLFAYFSDTPLFYKDFRKILKYQILLKSIQWEPSCSMRTDGRTDRHT